MGRTGIFAISGTWFPALGAVGLPCSCRHGRAQGSRGRVGPRGEPGAEVVSEPPEQDGCACDCRGPGSCWGTSWALVLRRQGAGWAAPRGARPSGSRPASAGPRAAASAGLRRFHDAQRLPVFPLPRALGVWLVALLRRPCAGYSHRAKGRGRACLPPTVSPETVVSHSRLLIHGRSFLNEDGMLPETRRNRAAAQLWGSCYSTEPRAGEIVSLRTSLARRV